MIAAFAAGTGVWTTHFIALLAYRGTLPMSFDPGLIPIGSVRESLSTGAVAAIGVGAMHFAGMAAIIAPAVVHYDWGTITYAYGIVARCFTLALFLFGRLHGVSRIAVPSLLTVVGVVSLHFTAMSATVLAPNPANMTQTATDGHGCLIVAIEAIRSGPNPRIVGKGALS